MRDIEGVADKCEDFINRAHQTGKRLDYLTARMPNDYEYKQIYQLKVSWRNTNPKVEQ